MPGSDTLTARLAQIRQRLQRSTLASTVDSGIERWVDAGPLLELEGEEFVRAAYRRLFDREPDAEGLRHNAGQLRSGGMTKPEMLTALAESPEGRHYRVRLVGMSAFLQHPPFESAPEHDPQQFVRAVSLHYNGREPADDSLARWVDLLETGSLSREDVVQLFAASARGYRLDQLPARLDEVAVLSSTLAEMRQELEAHQRALESLLPRPK